jgi:hypothetical protein
MQDQRQVFGFYHICAINRWEEVVNDQLQSIIKSGLYDRSEKIFVSVVGQNYQSVKLPEKFEIIHSSADAACYERKILSYMHDFCSKNTNNVAVWYIHSKGINHSYNGLFNNVTSWRKYMEYFVLGRHSQCLEKLIDNNTCGVNFQNVQGTRYHYSGNFWWANSFYIKTLPMNIGPNYCDPEFWLCINSNSNDKHACLFMSNVDHYLKYYDKSHYEV